MLVVTIQLNGLVMIPADRPVMGIKSVVIQGPVAHDMTEALAGNLNGGRPLAANRLRRGAAGPIAKISAAIEEHIGNVFPGAAAHESINFRLIPLKKSPYCRHFMVVQFSK